MSSWPSSFDLLRGTSFPAPRMEVSEYGVNDDVRYSNSSAESFPSRHRRSSSRTISE